MRLIWTTDNADQFRSFCGFLHAKAISFTTEEQVVRDWGSDQYGTRKYLLWVTEEDQVEKSITWLVQFIDNPTSPEFQTDGGKKSSQNVTEYLEERLKRPITTREGMVHEKFGGEMKLTIFILVICSLIFLYELYSEKKENPSQHKIKSEFVGISPVRKALLFDYPRSYELLDKIVTLYGPDSLVKPNDLPDAGKYLYKEVQKEPFFNGFFPYILSFTKKELGYEPGKNPPVEELTLFEKIRQGEIWRLVSPAVLHIDLLHLFFNMIWVLLLSTQIEARLGSFKLLLFMIIAGSISNTFQYLMTGPNFVGFSGIICAMATYIRARQQVAPWEAYQMSSSTFAFIMFFIGVLALLSFITFILQVFQNITLPIGIANTAHIVGAIVGYILGRQRFFSWQLHN